MPNNNDLNLIFEEYSKIADNKVKYKFDDSKY